MQSISSTSWRLAVILTAVSVMVSGCAWQKQRAARQPDTSVTCTQEYDPVCGADGVTYPNRCIAEQQYKVAVDHTGECVSPTSMTDAERKYLFWLLRVRLDQQQPSVRIRHLKTTPAADCSDCTAYLYLWSDTNKKEITARIIVTGDTISAAQDTTGYDYLTQQQGSPIVFPEAT